jgi:hypothetical protein
MRSTCPAHLIVLYLIILIAFLSSLAYFPKAGSCDIHAVCVPVTPPPPTINFSIPEPIFMKLGAHIMAPEPIKSAYLINPSHQSVSVCVSPYRC